MYMPEYNVFECVLYVYAFLYHSHQERDIIIFSCVRASPRGLGFLEDVRRMNVALTRAKYHLAVLGNSTALKVHVA